MVFVAPCPGSAVRPVLVDAPAVTKYAFGAVTAFDLITPGDEHERNGVVYKSLACTGGILSWDDVCAGPHPSKVPTANNQDTIVRGCPFTLYSRLDCKTTTLDALQGETETVFDLNEQRGIEREVWARLIVDPATTVLGDGTPATALGPVAGLAALESAIASCYPGQATIHADRGFAAYIASAACCLVNAQGGAMFTNLGSRWAFYAGAANLGPDGTPAPPGHAWLYATSQITLRRFERLSPEPVMRLVRDPATGNMTNEPFTLVERTYLATKECCSFAVLVCLPVC